LKKELIEKLIREAEKSMKNSLAPYSKFKVGAALLTKKGNIYTGCNIENPSLMLSVCAEKTAMLKALSEGERSFKAVAVVSSAGKYCYPCGSCRQVLLEFAGDIDVYTANANEIKRYSLKELLPFAFSV